MTDEQLDEREPPWTSSCDPTCSVAATPRPSPLAHLTAARCSPPQTQVSSPIALAPLAPYARCKSSSDHSWEYSQVREQLQRQVATTLATCRTTAWALWAWSMRPPLSSPAPRRPACSGSTSAVSAKLDNGIVTVHLASAKAATRP